MQKAVQGEFKPFDASDWKIGLVVAQFNQHITKKLEASAAERAKAYGIKPANITIVPVAGAVEIPLVLQKLASSGKYRALLAIGCVIQGKTPHFDYVCKFVTEGVMHVQLDHGQPIGFGILTCHTETQAENRASLGGEHLDAVLHQAKAIQNL